MSDATRGLVLLILIPVAVAIVVAAIIATALSGSRAVQVVAVVVLVVVVLAFIAVVFWVLRVSGVSTAPPSTPARDREPEDVGLDRPTIEAAVVTALQDAHALERGMRRFAEVAAADVRAGGVAVAASTALAERFERQTRLADERAGLLEQRLGALEAAASHAADDEAVLATWLYEHLLAPGAVTNARHGYGLHALVEATYVLIALLASMAGDEATTALASARREDLARLREAMDGAWEDVLAHDVERHGGKPAGVVASLLAEAIEMESMRSGLLAVSARQTRGAGIATGAEEAGLGDVVRMVDRQRAIAGERSAPLHERLQAVHGHVPWVHAWETFAAARTAGLVARIRGFKVVRDVRDLLAAARLAHATYTLLNLAAARAGDEETAALGRRLEMQEREQVEQVERSFDVALQAALLAE